MNEYNLKETFYNIDSHFKVTTFSNEI